MTETIPQQAPAEAQAARARQCPLCWAPPGTPCQRKLQGDHLARYLDAYLTGQLTRAYLAMVHGELVVFPQHDRPRWFPVTADRLIRAATAAVVVAVAAFAAVVSYSHIYDLGRAHGQDGTAARLLPLSVDGLILAASLVLLHEARNGRAAPRLARVMLWLGVAATLGANAAYGAPFGPAGVLVSTWPAVAFVGAPGPRAGVVSHRAR
jgi:hypothetical protein